MIRVFEMQEQLLSEGGNRSVQCRIVDHPSVAEYRKRVQEVLNITHEYFRPEINFNFQWIAIGKNCIGMVIKHKAYWQEVEEV